MGRAYLNPPPEPPAGQTWCPWCLMAGKHEQFTRHKAAIDALIEDEPSARKWLPWFDDTSLRVSMDRHLVPALAPSMTGILDPPCWDHVAGIDEHAEPQKTSNLLTGGAIPPGLMKGRG